MQVSPPGVVPQRGRCPRWIGDYTWSKREPGNRPAVRAGGDAIQDTLLERLLREVLLANPAHGPVHVTKTDLSDGFYRVGLNADDAP